MTLEDFILEKNYRKLSDKEIAKGKGHLKVYGTNEPMPWAQIYTRIAAGQPLEEVTRMYGHSRQLALWAQQEGVTLNPVLEDTIEKEVEHRQRISALANASPDVTSTLMEMVNEIAPDFQTNLAILADKVVKKGITMLDNQFLESTDLVNIMKAGQQASDTTGHTQRHANASQSSTNIQVTGFRVVRDSPPTPAEQITERDTTVIDVTPPSADKDPQ